MIRAMPALALAALASTNPAALAEPAPFATLPAALADDAPVVSGPLAERAHRHLARLEGLGFSGAVLIARGDETLLAHGYGLAQPDAALPMTTETLHPLGSISKHFTAATVLSLVQSGELSLDDTLGELLDDVPADRAGASVHQLLIHAAGFPEGMVGGFDSRTADELLSAAFAAELSYPPGEDVLYSNLGFNVLAALVETRTGEPFESVLRARILEPAGMHDTGISGRDWPAARLSHGIVDGRDDGPLQAGWRGPPWRLMGAGGMQTTLGDVRRYARALWSGALLDAERLRLMTTPHVRRGPGFAMGYGCGLMQGPTGSTCVEHSGSNDIFSANLRMFPEDELTVFVAANRAGLYADDVIEVVTDIAYGAEPPLPPAVLELPEAELRALTGAWRDDDGAELRVRLAPGGLSLISDDARAAGLLHPLPRARRERREQLMQAAARAHELAAAGDSELLHALTMPSAPRAEFEARHGELEADWREQLGAFVAARAVPGLNRFGEIGVVVVLEHERGEALVEYSFGAREVGSIRFLDARPARLVRPESAAAFVDYDPANGASWRLELERDEHGAARALLLDDGDGGTVRFTRAG